MQGRIGACKQDRVGRKQSKRLHIGALHLRISGRGFVWQQYGVYHTTPQVIRSVRQRYSAGERYIPGQPKTNVERSPLVPTNKQPINEIQLDRVGAIVTTSVDRGENDRLFRGALTCRR